MTTPADILRPLLYLVTWFDNHGRQHVREVANEEQAVIMVVELRYLGYPTAGWDRVNPLDGGDTNEGV